MKLGFLLAELEGSQVVSQPPCAMSSYSWPRRRTWTWSRHLTSTAPSYSLLLLTWLDSFSCTTECLEWKAER